MIDDDLGRRLREREYRVLSRCLTFAENDPDAAMSLLENLGDAPLRSWVLGLTGAPGVGKSTLVGRLLKRCMQAGWSVAVLAVDPSSPHGSGALLADRMRMAVDECDPRRVFVRSLASRGHGGGLSPGLPAALAFLDHVGFDLVIVETVGVGQTELEVMRVADCVALVLVAALGDEVQAIKSGVMEIADIFVVNKSDLPGTDALLTTLEAFLAEAPRFTEGTAVRPPVFAVSARADDGVDALWAGLLARHSAWQAAPGPRPLDSPAWLARRLAARFEPVAEEILRVSRPPVQSLDSLLAFVCNQLAGQFGRAPLPPSGGS